MMPNLDTVLDVLERHDPVADLLVAGGGFTGRKDVLENLDDTLPERSGEILKDEMGI